MKNWLHHALGAGLCLVAAAILTLAFRPVPLKGMLPLLFLGLVLFVAARFGSTAGILGTIGAAAVFAVFLFDPVVSLKISDSVQRNNVVWMMIIGIALSEIAGDRRSLG